MTAAADLAATTTAARPLRLLLAGTIVLLAFRVALTIFRTGPVLVADEIGYLTNARVIAGGVPSHMGTDQFYRGGYSLLLAPWLALDGHPATAYRLVLVVNAVLAAAVAPLLYLLLTRCFRASPRAAVWPALAAAAYPSVTVLSQVAMSENLLFPLTVAWLLCFGLLLDARGVRAQAGWAVAFALSATALLATHGRMVTAFALTVVALLWLALRGQRDRASSLVALVVCAGGYAAVSGLNHFLAVRNYGGTQPDQAREQLSHLASASDLLALGRNLVGETWYLIVATLALPLAFALSGSLRSLVALRRRDTGTPSLVLALLWAMTAALLLVSALSFPTTLERADLLIYGRYVEVIVPPLLALALYHLQLERRRFDRRVIGAVALATIAVVLLRLGVYPLREPNRWNVASLPFLTLSLATASIVGAGIVAGVAFACLGTIAHRARALAAPVALVLFLPTTAVAEHNPVLSSQRAFFPPGWTSPGAAVGAVPRVAYDMRHYDLFGRFGYQWFLPDTRFVLFRTNSAPPPAPYVISSPDWAQQRHSGARKLWQDPSRRQAIFAVSTR